MIGICSPCAPENGGEWVCIPAGLQIREFYLGDVWPGLGQGVSVEWCGDNSWAIRYAGKCADRKGRMEMEPQNSSRSDAWLKAHRFTLTEAAELAHKVLATLRDEARRVNPKAFEGEENVNER